MDVSGLYETLTAIERLKYKNIIWVGCSEISVLLLRAVFAVKKYVR